MDLALIGAALHLRDSLNIEAMTETMLQFASSLFLIYVAMKTMAKGPALKIEKTQRRRFEGTLIQLMNPNPYLFWVLVGVPCMLKLGPPRSADLCHRVSGKDVCVEAQLDGAWDQVVQVVPTL